MKMFKTGSLIDGTAVSAGKGHFWQQNTTPDRKSFITQSKHIIFLKAYDLLLFLWENWTFRAWISSMDFGHGPCCFCFRISSFLKEQFLKILLAFSQNYSIVKYSYKVKTKIKSKYKVIKL